MDENSQNAILSIMNYVQSTNLKGNVDIKENSFWWDLGNIILHFDIDVYETPVAYFYRTRENCLGHFHEVNARVKEFIQDINDENKIVQITTTFSGTFSFALIHKTAKKKKSRFFVRHYYSD